MEETEERLWAAMEERVIVSGSGMLRALSLPDLQCAACTPLAGAGALCARGDTLFCADSRSDAIWRLNGRNLTPEALFAGGPGICELALSPDGRLLYALCADGDSVLALDAVSGEPCLLARAGINPRRMALDEAGELLVIAAGEYGAALLMDASTLCLLDRLPMPGPVLDAALRGGVVYALCLNDALGATLVTILPGGLRHSLRLDGMPGALCAAQGAVLAATQENLYAVSPDGARVLARRDAPGRACRLLHAGESLLMCDELSETLYALSAPGARWRRICAQAADIT